MRIYTPVLALLLAAPLAPRAHAAADTPEEQLAAASALYDAKRYADAATRLDTFLAQYATHEKAGAAALALGRCRAELKQYPAAVTAYEKAVASKDPAVLVIAELGLGEAAMFSKQWQKAANALDAAVKSNLKPEQAAIAWYWLGQSNYELKKYDLAETAYGRVTKDYAKSDFVDSAWLGAALAALRGGRGDVARQRLQMLVVQFPKSEDRPQAMLTLAQMDLDAKRWREARQGMEALLAAYPQAEPDIRVPAEDGLIQSLLELADYGAAIPRLESALTRIPANDPQRFRADLSLGHCRYRQKQYEPALIAYSEAAKATDDAVAADASYWAANAQLALNRPAEAAALFQQAATRGAKNADLSAKSLLKAADSLAAAKQVEPAARAYRTVLDKYPQAPQAADARKGIAELLDSVSDPAVLAAAIKAAPAAEAAQGTLKLARLHIEAKRYADAVAPLDELIKSSPAPEVSGEASYLLGIADEAQQKTQPAVAAYASAVKLAPAAAWVADAQGRLAWLYLEVKKPADAEQAAIAVLALKPQPALEQQARLAMVQAQLDQQKWDAALEGCKALVASNPSPETTCTVLFTQAWVNEKRSKPDDALPLWEKIAAEYPRSNYSAEALVRVGDARMKAEKYDEAREKYAASLANFPKSGVASEARFKMGSALYNLNKYAEAAVEFDTVATDKSAGDYAPEGLYWAGVALDSAGKKDEAIQRLSKFVEQYPTNARVSKARVRLAALKAVAGSGNP